MEEYVLKHIRTFVEKIGPAENEQSSTVDLGEWANYLTFDVMGEVAFGRDFDMMMTDDNRDVPRLGNAAGHRALIVSLILELPLLFQSCNSFLTNEVGGLK
jgi:Cytochrome P450